MTGYDRKFGPPLIDVRSAATAGAAQLELARQGDMAFVFGTERSGLANDDVRRCQWCCAIPAERGVFVAESGAGGAGHRVRVPARAQRRRGDSTGADALR